MSGAAVIEADLTWTGRRFEPGVQVAVSADGRIESVGPGRAGATRHARAALLPGLINVHSHAFQRGLRGHGERFPAGQGDFWSWREAMYALVERLDEPELFRLSVQAFREMRDAGVTAVGEFHYMHHATAEPDYEFDRVVLEAAAAAGIRVVLLNTYYATGGIGRPLGPAQRRFRSTDVDAYWKQMDRLEAVLDRRTQTLGAVAHSIRAAGVEDIAALHAEAKRRGLPFHMHVEEQRREVEDCVAVYGRPPMRVLTDILDLDGNLTAVHCTHTEPGDMKRFLAAGGRVCVNPLTEGNLGDGIPTLEPVGQVTGRLCLGTDSNARISLIEEMRWLEYGQRLRTEKRGALRSERGDVAPSLLDAATIGGADALGLPAGRVETGRWADFAVIDLDHPSLAGCDPEHLAEAIVCGADNGVVLGTYVGGRWRESRQHARA
ncbi:MAG TPA: formimidoylglutamate deiminase [Gemmatimonadales bacterium]|nr:formimidoylglutamate deiminase [Gemmatimonadales bacterium]